MKKNKKIIIVSTIIILVLILLSGGTIAYFTAQETVTNKFLITSYDPDNPDVDPDDLFSIKISETDQFGNETIKGNTYLDITPGKKVKKDPTIQNTGVYSAWIRVSVIITKAKAWENVLQKYNITDITSLFGDYNNELWYRESNNYILDAEADTLTYRFYYNAALAPKEKVVLFKTFKMPEQFDVNDMASLSYFELKVTADAIQQENTGENAYYAFENFFE